MDWLLVWGVTQAAGFAFKPILEDLAKDAAKDYAKDFFKDCLKKVIHLPEKDEQKEAYGKALKEFLQFFQQELDDCDFQDVQIRQYIQPLKKFIKKPEIAAILGGAFEADCAGLDTQFLAKTWQGMNLPFLPDEFSWERVAKRYLKKVKAIIQESDKLRPIFAAQDQSQMAENLQELAGIAPDFDLGRYAEGLKEQYGSVKLESLDTTGVYYDGLKLWEIFIPQNVRECQEFLPQVYELPKDHLKRLREAGEAIDSISEEELERQRHRYINQQSQLVWDVIGAPTAQSAKGSIQQVVILGDPGSGKSSLLQYIALDWAERPLRDLSLYLLPLLLELRVYARDKQAGQCRDILSFIHGGNITCRLNQQELHERLRAGSVIALLDGVDEIFDPALRDEVVTDIHRFSNDYPQVQVIVTSRWLGYKGERLRGAGFRHFMLQELEIEQIHEFIERWHDLTFTDEADKLRKKERLIKALGESKSIRELAGNPLLLTMMAILNRNQELPRNRSKLYEKASEVLLYQWDVEVKLLENPKFKDWKISIELDHKQKMLRKVACFMQSNKKDTSGNLISKSDLENILTESLRDIIERGEPRMSARVMAEELRTRNFILCYLGADSYGFVHRTFLEYFCAWEFVWQFKETQTLTLEGLINEVFGAHWQDESWHEVLRLICGMIEPKFVAEIIDFLLEQRINLNDHLWADDVGPAYLTQEALSNLILAVNCFNEVRNQNLIATTSDQLLTILKQVIEWDGTSDTYLEAADILISFVGKIWHDCADTLPWLIHCLQFSESSYVPSAAVNEIAKGWKEDASTLSLLKNLILLDRSSFVRKAAMKAIIENWKEDPDTLAWLKDNLILMEMDHDGVIRVMETVSQNWKEDPDILTWLKELAVQETDRVVQLAAMSEIAKRWKEDPDTLPLLKDRVLKGKERIVRLVAIGIIIQNWKDDPDILPLLKDCALQDENWNVRQAAVSAIAKGWKENPDTLPLLKDCALQDENWNVRQVAVSAIAEGWKEDSELFELLANISLHDLYDPSVSQSYWGIYPRKTALQALVENFSDQPQTLEILNQVALNDADEKLREFAANKLQELEHINL